MSDERTEMEKRQILRLSNIESNRLTKECIQMALLHLMADRDISKISISEIVKRAGVSRTAFYNNFSTKEEVLMSLSRGLIEDLNKLTWDAFKDGSSKDVFRRVFQRVKDDSMHFSMAIKSGMPGREFVYIRSFVNEKYPEMNGPVRYLFLSWFGMMRNILFDWFMCGMKEGVDEMAGLCDDLTADLISKIREIDPLFMK